MKTIIVKIKKASFYKAFGKSLNIMRPVGEFTEDEVAKLSDDIKKGLIEVISESSVKAPEKKESSTEENKKEETEELKTESEETYHKEEANAETKKGRKKVN